MCTPHLCTGHPARRSVATMIFPSRCPTREPTAISVKSFGSGFMGTDEQPPSADVSGATSRTGRQGPLWTTQRREATVAYRTRWVVRLSLVSCGSSSGPPTVRSSPTLVRTTMARHTHQSSSASTPSRCKLLGPAMIRCLPTTPRWHSSLMLCLG